MSESNKIKGIKRHVNRPSYLGSVRLPTLLWPTLSPTNQFTHKLAHKTGVQHIHKVLLICQVSGCFSSLIWVQLTTLTLLSLDWLALNLEQATGLNGCPACHLISYQLVILFLG